MTGLGIESSSFRNGLPHESVLEMRRADRCRRGRHRDPDGDHADLFRTFPNSYGTPRLRPRLRHRARAGAALRLPPPRAVPARRAAHRSRSTSRGDRVLRGRAGRLPRRRRLQRRRVLPHARPAGPTTSPCSRSDYTGHQSTTARSRPDASTSDRARLPLALGHRLVLVLPRLRRPDPGGPPALAPKRWLRSDVYWRIVRLRAPLPRRGAGSTGGVAARRASASCRTSRSRSTVRPTSCAGSCARCRSSRSGCAPSGSADDGARRPGGDALAPLPAARRRALRQRRLLVDRPRSGRAQPTVTSTGASRRR